MTDASWTRYLAIVLCLSLAVSRTSAHEDKQDLGAIPIPGIQNVDAFNSVVEHHQVVVTVETPVIPPQDTARYLDEKKSLLERLDRKHGTWNNNHPRWRLLDALHGYVAYYKRQAEELDRLKGLYKKVSKSQKTLLEKHVKYYRKFTNIDHLLSSNQALADRIVESALNFYGIDRSELDKHVKANEDQGKKADKIAVSQSFKHIVRDWTAAGGSYERDTSFNCLLKTIIALFPQRFDTGSSVKVLLPGSGLNRLGHEVAQLGAFEVTVNEWSMYMNVLYRFLESNAHHANTESLNPFIDNWSHQATTDAMLRPLSFPDVPLNKSQALLVEGDFTTVFKGSEHQFDAIVTYFFIDTARNLVTYLETIKRLLRPGGYWVNLGPLLYGSAPFVQLSLEEVVDLAENGLGFEIVDVAGEECGRVTFEGRHVRGMDAAYGFDNQALTRNAYNAQFWVAKLPG